MITKPAWVRVCNRCTPPPPTPPISCSRSRFPPAACAIGATRRTCSPPLIVAVRDDSPRATSSRYRALNLIQGTFVEADANGACIVLALFRCIAGLRCLQPGVDKVRHFFGCECKTVLVSGAQNRQSVDVAPLTERQVWRLTRNPFYTQPSQKCKFLVMRSTTDRFPLVALLLLMHPFGTRWCDDSWW